MEKNRIPQIQLHTDEIHEIISRLPGWISRIGTTIIFGFFLLLFTLTAFIRYPDVIRAPVIITTSPAPVTLVQKINGSLRLLKSDNEVLKKGDWIAHVVSNTNPSDVAYVEQTANGIPGLKEAPALELGDLQPYYTSFIRATHEFTTFQSLGLLKKQVRHFNKQLQSYQDLQKTLVMQIDLARKEVSLSGNQFGRDSTLFKQGVLSAQDFNKSETAHLNQLRTFRTVESALVSNQIQINTIEKQLTDLEAEAINNSSRLLLNVEQTRRELLTQINKWKESNLLVAPMDGTLVYLKFLENDMFISQGQPLFSILPASEIIFGRAEIPVKGSGKVVTGQDVNIRLENFPAEQFGMLRGKVTEISALPSENVYMAKISLPNATVTTFNKKLPFKQQLAGETEIITADLTVLERIFYQFRSMIKA
jgi:multidrug resistance efflux pump